MSPISKDTETSPPSLSTRRRTLLIVDDDDAVRELMATVLTDSGEVLTARDGVEAVEVLLGKMADEIDLLITDRFMPRMGGDELATWFRSWNPAAKVLVVSTSFNGRNTDPNVSFLAKPFDLAALELCVRSLLAERKSCGG